MLSPILEELQKELGEKIKIVKINIDSDQSLSSEYNVMSIPTLVMIKDGKQVSVNVGSASKVKLLEWINSHV